MTYFRWFEREFPDDSGFPFTHLESSFSTDLLISEKNIVKYNYYKLKWTEISYKVVVDEIKN